MNKSQQQGFCFVPRLTTCFLFCPNVNNMAVKEKLRESSNARVISIKCQTRPLKEWVADWKGRSDENIILLHVFSSFSFSSESISLLELFSSRQRELCCVWKNWNPDWFDTIWICFLGCNTSCCSANQEFWAFGQYHLSSLGQSPKVGAFWRASLSH